MTRAAVGRAEGLPGLIGEAQRSVLTGDLIDVLHRSSRAEGSGAGVTFGPRMRTHADDSLVPDRDPTSLGASTVGIAGYVETSRSR
jgi:hypothetical protein